MDEKKLKYLVSQAKKGDCEAFGTIYAELKDEAYRFALYYLHDVHDAADAVQDASLKAYTNIRKLNKPESFRSWFFTIEANECRRILNARKRTVNMGEDFPDVPDNSHENMYLSAEVEEAMRKLSDEDRMIVQLAVIDGFKSNEISEIVGIKPASVRSRLSRALHSMRNELEKE